MNLPIVKLWLGVEVLERFMVTMDNGSTTHTVAAPFSKCLLNGKQFTIMCRVATLRRTQLLAIVAYRQQ